MIVESFGASEFKKKWQFFLMAGIDLQKQH